MNFRSEMSNEVFEINTTNVDIFHTPTIYGYDVKELIFFAEMCKRHNITEKDLHDFCLSAENGWQCGWDDFNRTQNKIIQEAMERFNKGGDG